MGAVFTKCCGTYQGSKFTVDYPYHKAISVHTKWIGMEYPQICFNGGRPEVDGTYMRAQVWYDWGDYS